MRCDTPLPQNGITFEALDTIERGSILVRDGRIAAVGHSATVESHVRAGEETEEVDLTDCIVLPGFVDAHAHPLFAGNRQADFQARVRGEPSPLGMAFTVEQTRGALREPERFWAQTVAPRLRTLLGHGTTTLETKTGYALSFAGESSLLRLVAKHSGAAGLPRTIATYLGAHSIPPEFPNERDYVDDLIANGLRTARADGAVYADVFCEPGYFSTEQSRRYLDAARANGLRLRAHCDEMEWSGAARMAVDAGVDAVDHCNCLNDEDVAAIAAAGVVTVACPSTVHYLGLKRVAPVRALLERGAQVALASDYNPGTSPCFNLQTVAYFGRAIFGLTAAEALYGVTVAAAHSLRAPAGRLRAGDAADFVALQIETPEEFGWQFGGNLASAVFRGGVRAP